MVVRFARQLAALERDTQIELGIPAESGPARLPIAVNADSLATWFLPALTRVPQSPPVCFDIRREDETHTAALLREGQVMAAVTSSAEPVAGCTVRPLGRARYLPVANPQFAARHLSTEPLEHCLPDTPEVVFDRRDELQDRFVRSLTPDSSGASPLRHHVPTSEGFRDAVAAGLGWGVVPEPQAQPLLRSGALTELAPGHRMDVPLYWQQWKLDVPALALVAKTITLAAAEALYTEG